MLQRAYSTFDVKSIDEDKRIIEGVASTPTTDRMTDVVEPLGGVFRLPLPFMWQHGKDPFVGQTPVGHLIAAAPTSSGIPVRIQMEQSDEPGRLKEILDFAWQTVKKRLVRGLSIGFSALDSEPIKGTFGSRFTKWEWLELSAVTIPANADASILTIKSIAQHDLAASGAGPVVVARPSAGVSAVVVRASRDAKAMTITEKKAVFAAEKTAKVAAMNALMDGADGTSLDASKQEQFDTLETEVKTIDEHLTRLETMERINKSSAIEVKATDLKTGSELRSHVSAVIQVKEQLPKGIGFARAVKARLVAKLDSRNVIDVAKEMYPSDDRLLAHLNHGLNVRNLLMQMKAAVPAATTAVSAWAGALVDPTNLTGEFIEYLRPATIIGRLNLRGIPTNVRLIEQTQGGTGYWVGQGAPKPLTAFGFSPVTLGPTKVAAIAVATEESLRYSTPSLDALIRDSLKSALTERVDRDLLDPAEAGTANVQPASLTSGLVALTSAGVSADNARTDIGRLVRALRTANLRGPIAVVLPDSLLTALAWTVNALGQPEFPGLTGEGGTFNGIRFIGSEYMANASGAGNMVVAIAESEVFVSDDGGVTVDASNQASLQMLDNPTNNSATATATTSVSMWQTNSVAFRGEWFINWAKRRSTAVAFMDDVNWGSVGSP